MTPYTQGWEYNAIGNITRRTDDGTPTDYTYGNASHKHAVTQAGANSFLYDANGNMLGHRGDVLAYDAENRLAQIVTSGGITMTYSYDGDGNRVKKEVNTGLNTTTTRYVGNYYEVDGGTVIKYYYFGGRRVAVNRGGTLSYLHGDHLGSMSVATDAGGGNAQSQRFYAYGGTRPGANDLPTDYAFTGQRNEVLAGLYQMGARWYDQDLGRFVQADRSCRTGTIRRC